MKNFNKNKQTKQESEFFAELNLLFYGTFVTLTVYPAIRYYRQATNVYGIFLGDILHWTFAKMALKNSFIMMQISLKQLGSVIERDMNS